ncbi:unnamed protein product [Gongylonema pulchrum]|uniref:Peptidase_M16_C domain-containing protein n=1 Tax=Gongylonema pulchrum TaxID=637853 RepID=A0A183DXT2_9BILA|nr:unnamed protein product [Gongylonema pulchrum]
MSRCFELSLAHCAFVSSRVVEVLRGVVLFEAIVDWKDVCWFTWPSGMLPFLDELIDQLSVQGASSVQLYASDCCVAVLIALTRVLQFEISASLKMKFSFQRRLASSSQAAAARSAVNPAEEKISRLPNGLTVASVDVGGAVSHMISRLPNGLTVASVDVGGAVSHMVLAYRAGTRYEMPDEGGLVHHIRNCIGADSPRYYGSQLLWQCGSAGANVSAMMTRDLLAVHMSVVRDRAAIGLSLLGELAQPAFKPWDVEEYSTTLHTDCCYLQPSDALMESLHSAAYRSGGLANRLYAPEKSIGKFDYRELQKFATSQMVTGNAVIVGVNIAHDQILDYANSQFTLPEGDERTPKPSPYCGGEERHKSPIKEAHVAIAGKGASLKNTKGLAVQAVLCAALGQGAAVKYPLGAGQGSVAKAAYRASSGYPFGYSAISEVYGDEGLVGVYLVAEADHIGPVFDATIKAIKSFSIDDLSLQTAKRLATMNVLTRAESSENVALDRAAQILATGKTDAVSDLLKEIASVTATDVTKGLAVQAVLCAALGQGAAVKYPLGAGQGSIAKAAYVSCLRASSGYPFGYSAISEVYGDEGLVGVYLVAEADHIGPVFDATIKAIKSFSIDDLSLQTAKRLATMNVLTRAESSENVALDRAAQILATGKTDAVSDLLKEIASVTAADVAKGVEQMKSKLTLASYGNIYQVPYLDQL